MIAQNPLPLSLNNEQQDIFSITLSDTAKMLGFKPKKFILMLSKLGFIFKRSKHNPWQAHQKFVNAGLFCHKRVEIQHRTGIQPHIQVRVTTKGVNFFEHRLKA